MTYLYREGMRAINPKFATAYKAYEVAKSDMAKPIKEEDVEPFKAALAAFGITTGKQLGRVLYGAGLLTGKDKGERQGQNLFKDLTALSYKQFVALCLYCDHERIEQEILASQYASYVSDLQEYAESDTTVSEAAEEELKRLEECSRAATQLDEEADKKEAANFFLYRLPLAEVDKEAAEELMERVLIEGLKRLNNDNRTALLRTMQGLLMAQYRGEPEDEEEAARKRSALAICGAIDTAATPGKPRKVEALADLLMSGELRRYNPERDNNGNIACYVDPETGDVVDDLQEAALSEYVSPREI